MRSTTDRARGREDVGVEVPVPTSPVVLPAVLLLLLLNAPKRLEARLAAAPIPAASEAPVAEVPVFQATRLFAEEVGVDAFSGRDSVECFSWRLERRPFAL